jgi:hypothetical protein
MYPSGGTSGDDGKIDRDRGIVNVDGIDLTA